MNKFFRILLIAILVFIPRAFVKAECSLNLNNLSISNQTNSNTADIIRLQSLMLVNNLYSGPITGYYGKLTEKAVNSFKTNNDLEADGIVDEDTINLLCNYSCPFKSLLEKDDEYPQQEIKFLQYFLRLIPNIYPEKLVTGFYGSKTESAVKRLQAKLGISESGKIDNTTRTEFCDFFNELDSETVNTKSETTSSMFQSLCLAFPANTTTGKSVTFISQILGGTSPYKYMWNNKTSNNEKTIKYTFNKAGTYTINLKVIDAKGNISTSNCNIKVTGDNIGENDLNLNELTFGDELDLNVNFGDTTTKNNNTTTTKSKVTTTLPLSYITSILNGITDRGKTLTEVIINKPQTISMNQNYKIDFLIVFGTNWKTSQELLNSICIYNARIHKEIISENGTKTIELVKNNIKYYDYNRKALMSFNIEDQCIENSVIRYKILIYDNLYMPSFYYDYKNSSYTVTEIKCGDVSKFNDWQNSCKECLVLNHPNTCTLVIGKNGIFESKTNCLTDEVLPIVDFTKW